MPPVTDYAPQHASGFTSEGSVVHDKLFDEFSVRRKGVIASGAGVLPRGALLGLITASRKWVLSLAAANDGSQNPRGVLLDAVDATAADAEGVIGRLGSCNGGALTLGAGHTLASIEDELMDRGIVLETIIGG